LLPNKLGAIVKSSKVHIVGDRVLTAITVELREELTIAKEITGKMAKITTNMGVS
jgi:hypothetical protein